MNGTIPALHQHLCEIAFSNCCANVFASHRNDQDVFAQNHSTKLKNPKSTGRSDSPVPRGKSQSRSSHTCRLPAARLLLPSHPAALRHAVSRRFTLPTPLCVGAK